MSIKYRWEITQRLIVRLNTRYITGHGPEKAYSVSMLTAYNANLGIIVILPSVYQFASGHFPTDSTPPSPPNSCVCVLLSQFSHPAYIPSVTLPEIYLVTVHEVLNYALP
jgi:hypothetical protein